MEKTLNFSIPTYGNELNRFEVYKTIYRYTMERAKTKPEYLYGEYNEDEQSRIANKLAVELTEFYYNNQYVLTDDICKLLPLNNHFTGNVEDVIYKELKQINKQLTNLLNVTVEPQYVRTQMSCEPKENAIEKYGICNYAARLTLLGIIDAIETMPNSLKNE